MDVVRILARSALRTSRGLELLAIVLLAITSGAAMFAVAGSRQTRTAFDRFVEWSRPAEVSTGGNADGGPTAPLLDRIEALPEVAAAARTYAVALTAAELPGGRTLQPPRFFAGAVDRRFGVDIERVHVVRGARPTLDDPAGAMTDLATADRFGLEPGDEIVLHASTIDGGEEQIPVRLTAVVTTAGAFPTVAGFSFSGIYLTEAFAAAHPEALDPTEESLVLRLVHGEGGRDELEREIQGIGLGQLDLLNGIGAVRAGTNKVTALEANVLLIAGAVVAAAGMLVVFQLRRREASALSPSLTVLGQLGARRRELAAAAASRGAVAGAAAGLTAVAIAVAASPLAPVGLARLAEIDPGTHVDLPVLGAGVLVTVLVGAGVSALAVALEVRRRATPASTRPEVRTRLPVLVRAAVGLVGSPGTQRRSRVLVGVCVPAVLASACLVARTSLDRLTADPRLSGGSWDAFITSDSAPIGELLRPVLDDRSLVEAWSTGGWDELRIGGTPVFSFIDDPASGVTPAIVHGRAPANDGEVALGAATMRAIGASIGDVVELAASQPASTGAAPSVEARVVGEVLVSSTLFQSFSPDASAVVPVGLAEALGIESTSALVTFPPHVDPQRGLDAVLARAPEGAASFAFARSTRGDVFALQRLVGLVTGIAVLLSILVLVVLLHQVVLAVRRNRRVLDVLRALGCTPGQVGGVGAASGALLALAAAAVGIPAGILGGKLAWRAVAEQMDVVPRPVVPMASLLVAFGALLAVLGLAGAAVARTRPAVTDTRARL